MTMNNFSRFVELEKKFFIISKDFNATSFKTKKFKYSIFDGWLLNLWNVIIVVLIFNKLYVLSNQNNGVFQVK